MIIFTIIINHIYTFTIIINNIYTFSSVINSFIISIINKLFIYLISFNKFRNYNDNFLYIFKIVSKI